MCTCMFVCACVFVLHLKKLNSQRDQIGYHPNFIMVTRVTSSGVGNETRRKHWRDSSGQGPHKQQFQRRPWFSECDFLSTSSLSPSLEAAHEVGINSRPGTLIIAPVNSFGSGPLDFMVKVGSIYPPISTCLLMGFRATPLGGDTVLVKAQEGKTSFFWSKR